MNESPKGVAEDDVNQEITISIDNEQIVNIINQVLAIQRTIMVTKGFSERDIKEHEAKMLRLHPVFDLSRGTLLPYNTRAWRRYFSGTGPKPDSSTRLRGLLQTKKDERKKQVEEREKFLQDTEIMANPKAMETEYTRKQRRERAKDRGEDPDEAERDHKRQRTKQREEERKEMDAGGGGSMGAGASADIGTDEEEVEHEEEEKEEEKEEECKAEYCPEWWNKFSDEDTE